MNSVLRIPLNASPEQAARLQALQQGFARVCNALAPLVQRLLLERSESLQPLWSKARLEGLLLEDVLKTSTGTEPALGVQQVV